MRSCLYAVTRSAHHSKGYQLLSAPENDNFRSSIELSIKYALVRQKHVVGARGSY